MRGYHVFDQADAILQAMQEFDHQLCSGMTMNTEEPSIISVSE